MIALERTSLRLVFDERYERFLARVHRHVASRLDRRRAIESLVERILAETIGDWMGPGEDVDRAIRVLARSRATIDRELGATSIARGLAHHGLRVRL